jgi:hypothetical protein
VADGTANLFDMDDKPAGYFDGGTRDDNGYSPKTSRHLTRLRRRHAHVRRIDPHGNLGFARANNVGAAAAEGDTFVFLNSDTIVPPDWLGCSTSAIAGSSASHVPRVTRTAPGSWRCWRRTGRRWHASGRRAWWMRSRRALGVRTGDASMTSTWGTTWRACWRCEGRRQRQGNTGETVVGERRGPVGPARVR